jgi:hypothetical protein
LRWVFEHFEYLQNVWMRDFSESLSFLFELFLIPLNPSRLFDHLDSPIDRFVGIRLLIPCAVNRCLLEKT